MSRYLPWVLVVLAAGGLLGYSTWFRELPRAEGRITGDYAQAVELAGPGDSFLLLAVDAPPH